jgi:hypothetical protein
LPWQAFMTSEQKPVLVLSGIRFLISVIRL